MAAQLLNKSEITKDVLKQIPSVLERPVAISESYDNTVMVFGRVFDAKGNPIVIALRIYSTNRRNHVTLVNKIRSVGTRSHNLDKLLSKDSLLYLSKNKKETVAWFNALGRSTPFGGTKFGLIRSISFQAENSNRKIKTSAVVRDDTVAPIEKRLRGDALLDAQDLVDTVMDIGGEVDGNGIGEDGFHYFEAFFENFDGGHYQVTLSAGLNGQKNRIQYRTSAKKKNSCRYGLFLPKGRRSKWQKFF